MVSLRGHRAGRQVAGAAAALTLLLTLVVVAVAPGDRADAALANQENDPTVRVHGAVTVIGDSVLQGSFITGPTLVERLAERGWGPIRGRAGVGYTTGAFSAPTEARATYWIDQWRRDGWDAPNVLVNLGANDSGRCDRSVSCARDAILTLVDEIGPGHNIWWPMITRHPLFRHQADTWNTALAQIAAERDDFFTWDWAAVLAANGFPSPDNTHLSSSGYRERSAMLAREFSADLAFGTRTAGDAPLPSPDGQLSTLVPIDPIRLIDTRVDPPGRVAADTAIEVDVSAHVPDDATAVAVYVSATNTRQGGFLTAFDCDDERPLASAANHEVGETRGAVTITPISTRGTFCLYTLSEADLLVDLQAAFVPDDAGLRFDPFAVPERLVDTRETGRSTVVVVEVPDDAAAVSISLTAVYPDEPGFLTAYPCDDDRPLVATVNYDVGELVSGTAFLPVADDSTICVYSHSPTDVTVDLTGTFGDAAELAFQPATPARMLDTRDGTGGWSPLHGRRQTYDVRVAPPGAVAVSGTLTMVTPLREGFQRSWGCGPTPPSANVTALSDAVLANHVSTAVSGDGRLCIYSHVAGHTVFDTTGWWVTDS